MAIEDVQCTNCHQIINWSGECECRPPYAPMTDAEYRARFTHPFMRKNMKQFDGSDQIKH